MPIGRRAVVPNARALVGSDIVEKCARPNRTCGWVHETSCCAKAHVDLLRCPLRTRPDESAQGAQGDRARNGLRAAHVARAKARRSVRWRTSPAIAPLSKQHNTSAAPWDVHRCGKVAPPGDGDRQGRRRRRSARRATSVQSSASTCRKCATRSKSRRRSARPRHERGRRRAAVAKQMSPGSSRPRWIVRAPGDGSGHHHHHRADPGKPAPKLITAGMIESMTDGGVKSIWRPNKAATAISPCRAKWSSTPGV